MKIRFNLKFGAVFIFIFVLSISLCFGQNTVQDELNNLLRKNSYPIKVQNGSLSGDGAKVLALAMSNIQFVALGEVHNRRSVHKFGDALFKMLSGQYGFNYLALEEDPYLGKLSSQAARSGGSEAMIKLAQRYPNAFHLLTQDELEMIGNAGKISKGKMPIWGLNQVFGATHIYERLVQLAPDSKSREVAQRFLNIALEYEKERFQKNVHYVAGVAKPADFEQLRSSFKAKSNLEAEWLINQIALSNQIFSPYVTKPRPAPMVFYQSNVAREENMKLLFADHYRQAQAAGDKLPKVMAMFGQLHLYRGLSENTDLFTLGNYLSEVALFNGKQSFHIYTTVDSKDVRSSWQGPIIQAIENVGDKSDDGILVDLRPLKALAITRNPDSVKLDPKLRRLILGFDTFLFFRDGTLGALEKLRTPNFRMYADEN